MKKAIRPAIFKWRQTDPELILCAVRWYLRYSLSLRDVEELHSERGLEADHTTIWRGSYWSPFRRTEGGQRRVDQKVVPEGIVPLSRLQHSVDPAEVVEAGAGNQCQVVGHEDLPATSPQCPAVDNSDRVVLDMDSTESPVHGQQEGSAYNGHFESICYHPLLLFNQHGDCLAAKLRPGNVSSAEDWDELLVPEIERQQGEGKRLTFRADAAFAKPEIYEALEDRGVDYVIRIPANKKLEWEIADILFRPPGRPSAKPLVRYKSFRYQAESWSKPRRLVAKVEHHLGELFARLRFIVTNMSLPSRSVVRFYNKRGTAEQWIKEGKQATHWTRLSCHRFRANEVRLQLSVLAYNLGNLWRRLGLPQRIKSWSLTSLQHRLMKTGGRLVKHARYYWLLLAEGHLSRKLFGDMLRRIWALPVPGG